LRATYSPGWAVIAGLVGGIAFLMVVYMGFAVRMTRMNFLYILGSMMVPKGSKGTIYTVGFMVHMMLAAGFVLVHAAILHGIGISSVGQAAGWDLLIGAIHGMAVLVIMPMLLVAMHPLVRTGDLERPGVALSDYGGMTPDRIAHGPRRVRGGDRGHLRRGRPVGEMPVGAGRAANDLGPAVAFDVIGTLFTLDRPRERLTKLGAPPHSLELWFAQALRDAFAWSHAGGYRPLKEFLEAALPRTLDQLGVTANDEGMARVIEAFGELDPVEGAREAVSTLADAGWRVLALTNGSEDSTRGLLARAGVEDRFSALLSCDRVQKTKPHPDVYGMARQEAGAGSLWLIAAHAWDIGGAARAGLRTCWVAHSERRYLSIYPEPDVRAASLVEAARGVIDREGQCD
jgi:2-haloacid dehalogenase